MQLDIARRRFLESGEDRDLPIVDAHLHFWDPTQNYHPWLCDEPLIPFRYGDYRAIRRPFLPQEYRRLAGVHRVLGCVYMEAEWAPEQAVGEAAWIQRLHQATGWPNAMLAQAWLDRDDIEAQLAALSDYPLVKGVRHKPTSMRRQDYRPGHGLAGSLECSRYQAGVAALARRGWIFELQVPWWHLGELVTLLERHPDMPVVINHAGVPGDRDPATLAGWRAAMHKVAVYPQVMLKLSGIGLADQPWRLADNRELLHTAIELFGPERCMFASNFPVDSLVVDLAELFDAFKAVSAGYTREQRLAMFCDNAVRCYGLDDSRLALTSDDHP
ncbi:amidohydrolase family protein [Halomonas sp. DP5Y7-2]|uniref:amidohydrolase family protein n=1 Tax=Halomonas sp. DP5Y7-2 TaxID=2859076 RepID=UPI001C9947C4|nr:amidohydrolase family protein [Halomonas sp. DP5Y7-2]MBY5983565.1 amidohydrolase family protein [Halomonas sp. DP5Y7-2]